MHLSLVFLEHFTDTTAVLRAANVYADMLIDVIRGTTIPEAAQTAGLKMNYDVATDVRRNSGRGDPMTACYITSSFPVMLFFAYKYGEICFSSVSFCNRSYSPTISASQRRRHILLFL